jgi:hypothetical protein
VIGHEYKVGGHASSTDERVTEEMWAVQIGSMRDRLPDAKILRLKIMTLPGLEIHLGLRALWWRQTLWLFVLSL